MSTSFEKPYKVFFNLIERVPDFFNYFNLTIYEALDVAKKRANGYLLEAIHTLYSHCEPEVDFYNYSIDSQEFLFDLQKGEIILLGNLMFEHYLEKDIARLGVQSNYLTSQDLGALYSPANERKEFVNMFKMVRENNVRLIKAYAARDRITNKRKVLDHHQYSEDGS